MNGLKDKDYTKIIVLCLFHSIALVIQQIHMLNGAVPLTYKELLYIVHI